MTEGTKTLSSITSSDLSVERCLLVVLDQLDEALELCCADDEEASLLLYQAVLDLWRGDKRDVNFCIKLGAIH